MLIPEYTITNNTLKNVAAIENGKATIEAKTILSTWEKQLQKDTKISFVDYALKQNNEAISDNKIKRALDKLDSNTPAPLQNILKGLELTNELKALSEFEEDNIKHLHKEMGHTAKYRDAGIKGKPKPEEILAQMVELMDWYNGLDSKETHPVLRAGILKAYLEHIAPFKNQNSVVSNLAVIVALKSSGYAFKGYALPESYYNKSEVSYDKAINSIEAQELDLTEWLEFFTQALAFEVTNVKEKINLLARDTKLAKASGKAQLSARQEKIILYLQDYGMLQNKDFGRLFPGISEDTVLRELKKLVDKGLIVKRGSTKASRYELNG